MEAFPQPKPFLTSVRKNTMALKRKYKRHFGHKKKLVGMAWGSNNPILQDHKSIPLGYWYPLLQRDDVGFVSVQHHFQKDWLDRFNHDCNTNVYYDKDIAPEYLDIEDTVSQLDAMDIVITASNSAAHLAGALGKETWVLLPRGRGRLWFWFRGHTKSIWYPDVKMFNQYKVGEWDPVIEDVCKEMDTWVSADGLPKR